MTEFEKEMEKNYGREQKEVKARKKAFRKAKHRAIRPWKDYQLYVQFWQ